jgi:hypothetical protein
MLLRLSAAATTPLAGQVQLITHSAFVPRPPARSHPGPGDFERTARVDRGQPALVCRPKVKRLTYNN